MCIRDRLYNSGETLYAGENYGDYTSASSLGEYWTMDDIVETGNGSGTTLFGEINDNDGTLNGGPSWSTDFPGTVPSLSSSSPVDDETNVLTDINIVLNFSEIIKVNSGNITLKKTSDDSYKVENSLSVPLKEARENFEKEYLTTQLKKFGGNISKTAEFVGMERSALHRKLKGLGVKDLN